MSISIPREKWAELIQRLKQLEERIAKLIQKNG